MNPLDAIVAAASAGMEEFWEVGPITARDAARFAAASGDVDTLGRLRRGDRTAPALMLSSVLDWGAGTDVETVRADGLSQREAPYVGDHEVRLVHGGQALRWYRPVLVGDDGLLARRTVVRAEVRAGRSGTRAVVGLRTRYVLPGRGPVATCDESVFCLAAGDPQRDRRAAEHAPAVGADVEQTFSAVALARFSAVTWNSHRIHLDERFALSEGFGGPVVQSSLHGVTLLRAASRRSGATAAAVQFSWRNLSPVVAGERVYAAASADGRGGWDVVEWSGDGLVTARGHVRFRSGQWTGDRDGVEPIRDTRPVVLTEGGVG